MKISKGSMSVMTDSLKNGLYTLNGSFAVCAANVAPTETENEISIWHKRLAHVSERGLKELQKQGMLGNTNAVNLPFYEQCV